ncbi:hypothetical protein [uncultured Photobacterium sp.]|uniref:hypothetical protein n=1 Tax=uncultured Photobacterium sp. TaxID=173973 RepID=UPI00260260FC|nr:hypothetical protein [uncultured Photobacterium sp.]
MRKTHIALLVAVVSSPLAFADGHDPYDYDYDPYSGSGSESYDSDEAGTTVTDSFNKDIDKTLTVTYEKDISIKDSYNEDNDYMSLYDVNNKDIYKFTDNSKYDNSKDIEIDIEENYYMATSTLEGTVTYSEVTYGGGCCSGYGHDYSYGDPVPSSLTVTQTNTMQDAFTGASGINIAGQNAGNNSLVQQSASTNAMLTGQ